MRSSGAAEGDSSEEECVYTSTIWHGGSLLACLWLFVCEIIGLCLLRRPPIRRRSVLAVRGLLASVKYKERARRALRMMWWADQTARRESTVVLDRSLGVLPPEIGLLALQISEREVYYPCRRAHNYSTARARGHGRRIPESSLLGVPWRSSLLRRGSEGGVHLTFLLLVSLAQSGCRSRTAGWPDTCRGTGVRPSWPWLRLRYTGRGRIVRFQRDPEETYAA